MFTLKDGSQVKDARLARCVQFDERSRNYPIREILTANQQKPVTKSWRCRGYFDQGQEGACVGFSMAHELVAEPVPVRLNRRRGHAVARRIYHEAQRIDEWPGGAYEGADPFYEGTSVLAGIKVLKKKGHVTEYRWAFGLQDLILAVGHLGPAILGINWYEGMFDVHGCRFVHPFGELAGGHAILCRAVNVKRKLFVLHNSWGRSWGNRGTCLISWDDMDRLLHEDGEALIPLTRVEK